MDMSGRFENRRNSFEPRPRSTIPCGKIKACLTCMYLPDRVHPTVSECQPANWSNGFRMRPGQAVRA